MAIPNPFRRWDSNTKEAWGYAFQWTEHHMTPDEYRPLKYSYDTLAEECLVILNEISPPAPKLVHTQTNASSEQSDNTTTTDKSHNDARDSIPSSPPKRDLYALLRDNHTAHPKLQQLWDECTTTPPWVDWAQIARGQEFFYRYGGANLNGLAFQSLLGGMAAGRVVEVLARTGGFSTKVARHRLFETTQHVLECTKSLDDMKPGGAGFVSSIRVRLLHAAVRQRIMKLVKSHPSYYDVEKNGVPINDLDCMGTISAFSTVLLFISLPRQGIFPRQQETDDYVALWRLVAHYTGTPTDFFSSTEKARGLMESLHLHELKPTDTSRVLANNVIRALENTPPAYTSRDALEVKTRWLNGHQLSDALDIGHPPWYQYVFSAGQFLLIMAVCYISRSIPALDRRKIAGVRRVLWHIIVENKEFGLGGETEFGFKYLPEVGKTTIKEDGVVHKKGSKRLWRDVETRNLKSLVVLGIGIGGLAWVGVRVGRWVLGAVFK